jgi:Acyltransferase family
MVIGSHLVLCFARSYVFPAAGPDISPDIFQLPIIRLPTQGLSWVLLFITLSSYAAALKPIKLSRSGKAGEALSSLASSSFRRTGRLFLPSLTATVLSWFLCQIGAYEIGRSSDAWWISSTSRESSRSWIAAFRDLINCIIETWTIGDNSYDQPQWTLLVIFQASMLTYTLLLATVHAQSKHRMLISLGFYAYSWKCGQCKFFPLLPSLRV